MAYIVSLKLFWVTEDTILYLNVRKTSENRYDIIPDVLTQYQYQNAMADR